MKEIKAVAAPQPEQYATLTELFHKAVNFMYGDKRRMEITIAVAFGLMIIAKMLLATDHASRYACLA